MSLVEIRDVGIYIKSIEVKCWYKRYRYLSSTRNECKDSQIKNIAYLKTVGLFSHNVYYVKWRLCGVKFIVYVCLLVYQVHKN